MACRHYLCQRIPHRAAGITGAAFIEVSLSKIKSIKNSIGKTKKPAIILIESGGWLEAEIPSEEEAASRKLINPQKIAA
jgi:hypothetical protein